MQEISQTLFVALELSRQTWLVTTFSQVLGEKISVHSVPGGNAGRLLTLITELRSKMLAKGVANPRIVSCYEAGYDGFWLHRVLQNEGIENHVLDGASLPIDRRAKQVKTDNIDAKRLLRAIVGHVHGDPQACRVVRAPSADDEDERRLHRERQRLVRERTGHINRIKALLIAHGIRALRITDKHWCQRLAKMKTGDGRDIPPNLLAEVEREWQRLKLVAEQIKEVEAERDRLVVGKEPIDDRCVEKMRALVKLRGIGADFATALTREVFYREFDNRRQVASYVGLAPAPYDSGDSRRDQGINKAGNSRARVAAVQMAWMWLRYQPQSDLAKWYYSRVGNLEGRVRRVMIIALARKLVIALWRYLEAGLVPKGATISA